MRIFYSSSVAHLMQAFSQFFIDSCFTRLPSLSIIWSDHFTSQKPRFTCFLGQSKIIDFNLSFLTYRVPKTNFLIHNSTPICTLYLGQENLFCLPLDTLQSSLVAQMIMSLPVMWETWIRSLGWEDTLEKEVATHFSILAWKIPWTEEPGNLRTMAPQSLDTTERLSLFWYPS